MQQEQMVAENIAQGHAPPPIGRTAEYFQNLCRFIPDGSRPFCIVTLLHELVQKLENDAVFQNDHRDFDRVQTAWIELKKNITNGEWHEALTTLELAPSAITEHQIGRQFKKLIALCHEGVTVINDGTHNVA